MGAFGGYPPLVEWLLGGLGVALALGLGVNMLLAVVFTVVGRPLRRLAAVSPFVAEAVTGSVSDAGVPPPFVSVHVATHDEPPDMVIATVEALLASDYPAFEILVLDNNTPDPATWGPVAAYAARRDSRVRFFHFDGVEGAKAGALNLGLAYADPRAAFVAVVDADYRVSPGFLARGVAACGPGVAFAQFPQTYRHTGGAEAVVGELGDYFETFPRAANRARAALLTGTLSVISVRALKATGGWPTRSLVEDAELGVRLWSRGVRGVFVPEPMGDGLLPLDLAGLRLQRRRWVQGNAQTLRGLWGGVHGEGASGARTGSGVLAVVAQLTAWTGALALPLVALVVAALVRAGHDDGPGFATGAWTAVEALAALTIGGALAGQGVRALARRRPGQWAVTLALLWSSSFAWLSVFRSRPLAFERTPKGPVSTPTPGIGRRRPDICLDTVGSWLALATAAALALEGAWLAPLALAFSAAGLLTAPFVDRALRRAGVTREESLICRA